jgi:hypothetical protein
MSDDHDDEHEGLEPKLSIEELRQHGVVFGGHDGREYRSELPGAWSNSKVAATDVEKVCHECRESPYFDVDGYGINRELARRISEAFQELKGANGFVLAWRLYPEKDHPRWKVADGCGCGCGGFGVPEQDEPESSVETKHPHKVREEVA